jgi:hypothetical protein
MKVVAADADAEEREHKLRVEKDIADQVVSNVKEQTEDIKR